MRLDQETTEEGKNGKIELEEESGELKESLDAEVETIQPTVTSRRRTQSNPTWKGSENDPGVIEIE